MVHLIQQLFTEHLKITLPQIRRLEYFSVLGNIKIRRISIICAHNKDFVFEGTWTSLLLRTGNHHVTELVE